MVAALLVGEYSIVPLGVFSADAGPAQMNNRRKIVFLLDRRRLIADGLHHLAIE